MTISTCIAVLNPKPIKTLLGNKIPILESRGSCIVLKGQPVQTINISTSIDMEVTQEFVLNGVKINMLCSSPYETKCSGTFCDRQRVAEVAASGRGCGYIQCAPKGVDLLLSMILQCRKENSQLILKTLAV